MKYLFSLLLAFLSVTSFAQTNTKIYAVAVNFGSIGTGVPSSDSLMSTIKAFKKKYKIKKISYDHIGPLGKEGEYMLGFPLKELTKRQKTYFIAAIKKVKPAADERGTLNIEENVPKPEVGGRTTITKEKI